MSRPQPGQLVHPPDAGQVLAIDLIRRRDAVLLSHKDGGHPYPLPSQSPHLISGIFHAGLAVIFPADGIFPIGRDPVAVVGVGVGQDQQQMLLCRSRLHQLLHSPQGQPIPVPARREIVEYPPLPMLVAVLLQHPQHRIAPQTAKAGDPHGDAAVQQALCQDIPLGRNGFLTVQPGRRTIQQQIHAESGPRFLVLPQKHPVVPQHRAPAIPGSH